jgi:hypothetical protein
MNVDDYRAMLEALAAPSKRGSAAAMRRGCPTEGDEQRAVFEWARLLERRRPELALLLHIPNGGLRNAPEAARFKGEGVRRGFPDMFLPVARGGYHGLMVELKRARGGRVSDDQMAWLSALNEQGYRAVVARGAAEAIREITQYLDMPAYHYSRGLDCLSKAVALMDDGDGDKEEALCVLYSIEQMITGGNDG